MWWLLSVLMVAGCGPKAPAETPPDVKPGAAPILPAPDSAWYAPGESTPRDPLVAAIVGDVLPWKESLSGAAGALALGEPFVTPNGLVRWSAIRAGYPHPIQQVITGEVPIDTFPTALRDRLQSIVRPGDDLGLVRARIRHKDRWVAIIGRPALQIPTFPKEIDRGAPLPLIAEGGEWSLQSPTGRIIEGTLPSEPTLSQEGEWWLQIKRGDQTVMSVPIYVGLQTPMDPPVLVPGEVVIQPSDALELSYILLNELRDDFSRPLLRPDPVLETLAQHPLEQALVGQWDPAVGTRRLQGAGFVGGPVGQVYCEGRTVAECLDSLMWDIETRSVLLDPGLRVAGASAQVRTDGLAMVFNLASE